jgi:glutamate 5-kinase
MKTRRSKKQLWVVKLGSGLLSDEAGRMDGERIGDIVRQVAALNKKGIQAILVSSGAISAGMSVLGHRKRPTALCDLQVCASVGQPRLMAAYQNAFAAYGMSAAQILVTYWDLDSRKIYTNAQATLKRMLELGSCVPVVNENDALSFEEIEMLNKFGDNDRLSAYFSLLSGADRLVILSTIDGLMDRPDGTGKLIRRVRRIDPQTEKLAGNTASQRSVGGMTAKLQAAKIVMDAGIPLHIANGRAQDVLLQIARGENPGTLFQAG